VTLITRVVDCGCDEGLELTVLEELPGRVEMRACMRCGALGLAEAIVEEPEPYDVQFIGFEPVLLSAAVTEWVGAWPRLTTLDGERVLVGAGARIQDRAGLQALVGAQERGWNRGRLMELGVPEGPPPAELPLALRGFGEIWRGLSLNDATPVEELMREAMRVGGPNRLAREVLSRRGDLAALSAQWRASREDGLRVWGRYLAKEFSHRV
jgi:hypothetical protein